MYFLDDEAAWAADAGLAGVLKSGSSCRADRSGCSLGGAGYNISDGDFGSTGEMPFDGEAWMQLSASSRTLSMVFRTPEAVSNENEGEHIGDAIDCEAGLEHDMGDETKGLRPVNDRGICCNSPTKLPEYFSW